LKMRNIGLLLVLVAIMALPAVCMAKGKKHKDTTPPTPTPFDLPATVVKADNGTITASLSLPTTSSTMVTIDGASRLWPTSRPAKP